MMIYCCIAKNKKSVLCEYTEYNGNFQQVSTRILEKVNSEDNFSLNFDA
jgi:hypothetical protein